MDDNTKKMLAGEPYCPDTKELNQFSKLAHRLCRDYTLTTDDDTVERTAIIDRLFPRHGDGAYFQGPFLSTTVVLQQLVRISTLTLILPSSTPVQLQLAITLCVVPTFH